VLELVGEWQEAATSFQKGTELSAQGANDPVQAVCQRAMGWLLRKQGDYREAVTWLTQARTGFERLGDFAATSQVMADIGEVSRHLGGFGEAKARYDEALRLADSVEERASRLRARAYALKGAGTLAAQQGDLATARSLYEESLTIRRDLGDKPGAAVLLHNLGIVAYYLSDYAAARGLDEEALGVFREIGDRFAVGQALNNLAGIASATGDYALARHFLAESVEIQRQLGDKGGLAIVLNSLADVLQDEGDHDAARPLLVESLTINLEIGDQSAIAYLLDSFAALASATQQPERALRLAGAAVAAHDRIGSQLSAGERARFDRLQAPTREALGESLATARWEEGQALSSQEAIRYALEAGSPSTKVSSTPERPRERPSP
jgi:tetratricopeptide (TPR) repeat protein